MSSRRDILKLFFGHDCDISAPAPSEGLAASRARNISQSVTNLSSQSTVPGGMRVRRNTISCGLPAPPKILASTTTSTQPAHFMAGQRLARKKNVVERSIYRKKVCVICDKKFITLSNDDICAQCARRIAV